MTSRTALKCLLCLVGLSFATPAFAEDKRPPPQHQTDKKPPPRDDKQAKPEARLRDDKDRRDDRRPDEKAEKDRPASTPGAKPEDKPEGKRPQPPEWESYKAKRAERREKRRKELKQELGKDVERPEVKQELNLHAARMAKLNRLEILAKNEDKSDLVKRAQTLKTKENSRHASRLKALKGGAK
ncbi:MAG: hypothetical protein H6718_22155 [Polyangiaceae bacterium]|nr:hypothetical protein [Polyangiaceae bacterium]